MEAESTDFTKEILLEGHGVVPKPLQQVKIAFKMTYSTGEPICQSSQPHKIALGRGQTLKALEKALLDMKTGERSRITIKNPSLQDPKFQKGKNVVAQVELLSLGSILPLQKCLNLTDRQNFGRQCKQQGNQYMKAKKYDDAIRVYLDGYNTLEFDTSDNAEDIKVSLLSNLSQAYLNYMQYEKAIDMCSKVLEDQPNNVKILYRRANGYRWLGKYDEAMKDIETGKKVNPESAELQSLIEQIKKQRQDDKKKEKAVYGRMFSS